MEGGDGILENTGSSFKGGNGTKTKKTFTYPDKEGNTVTQEMTIISRKK